MDNRNNEEIWAYTAKLQSLLNRAKVRCNEVAWSEQMFGYLESARQYTELEEELAGLITWARQLMDEFIEVRLSHDSRSRTCPEVPRGDRGEGS